MINPLEISISTPLEREYEAWIIRGIEDYFASLGKVIAVWAVSPSVEVNWPADEAMIVGKKLIGLQMKKAYYKDDKSNKKKFSRLMWPLHNPTAQFNLVVKYPEIYYCLPTFVNRNFKAQALSHCIFWRPDPKLKENKNAWYDNPAASTPYNSIGTSPRWGKFIEDIMQCTIGKKIDNFSEAKIYIESIRGFMRESSKMKQVDNGTESPDHEIEATEHEMHTFIFAIPLD